MFRTLETSSASLQFTVVSFKTSQNNAKVHVTHTPKIKITVIALARFPPSDWPAALWKGWLPNLPPPTHPASSTPTSHPSTSILRPGDRTGQWRLARPLQRMAHRATDCRTCSRCYRDERLRPWTSSPFTFICEMCSGAWIIWTFGGCCAPLQLMWKH